MISTNENPSLEDVSYVIDGHTGNAVSPAEYAKHLAARLSSRFIKGPIPLPWLVEALTLTPSAVKCALALFYQRGLSRSDQFKIEPARFRELGIENTARRRGLSELEEHGLVRLDKEQSKSPIACIIHPKIN